MKYHSKAWNDTRKYYNRYSRLRLIENADYPYPVPDYWTTTVTVTAVRANELLL